MFPARRTQLLALTMLLLTAAPLFAQTPVRYRCSRPRTGSPAVSFRWYLCRPDSNTLIYQGATSDTFATIVHQRDGERVRVEAVDALGRVGPHSVASNAWALLIQTGVPEASRPQLHGACPNPFNPRTTVSFDLPEARPARLTIHAVDGRRVRLLADAPLPAGRHEFVWDGRDDDGRTVASGVYVCRLATPGGTSATRLTLVR